MKVKEFATVVSGATPSSKCPDYYDGDIAWFTPKDLSDQGTKHVSQCERYITKAGYDSCSTTMLPAGSVLMSSRAPIGLLAITDVPCCTNQGFKSFDIDRSKCDPEYLYYYLKLHIKEVESLGSGTTFKEVSKESVENYDVALPDLDVQQHIISVLRDIDSKIANNTAICSSLEAMAKLLYDYWFVQFDFPDESGKPYKSSGGKMVWNDELKREIPAGWEGKSISDISKRVKVGFVGTVDKYYCSIDEGYPIVRPAEMSADGIDYSSLRHITLDFYNKNKKSQVHKNDILISRCGKDGIPNIYDSDEPAQVLNAVIIEPDEDTACSCFINEMLKSDYSQVQISHGTSGSVQGVINTEMIAKIIMPYNYDVVTRFSGRIEDNYAIMRNAKRENQQLASLLEFLLPMLMNGQVKVGKDGA